jgi:hypothetical protein
VAGAAVGASAGQAAFSIVGDTARYNAEKGYRQNLVDQNRQQIDQNRSVATQEYLNKVRLEQLGEQQENAANVETGLDLMKQRRAAQASAKVQAAEGGVAGLSVDHLLLDFQRQESFAMGRIVANQEMVSQQRKERISGYATEHRARSNAIPFYQPAPIRKPDYVGPIFGVINTGLQAFGPSMVKAGAASGGKK